MEAKLNPADRERLQHLFRRVRELSGESLRLRRRERPLQVGLGLGGLLAVGEAVFRSQEIEFPVGTVGLLAVGICWYWLYGDKQRHHEILLEREQIAEELAKSEIELTGDEFRFKGETLNPLDGVSHTS